MFAKMGGKRLPAESDGAVSLDAILRRGVREKPDVSALASLEGKKLCVLVWHYHDDDVPGPEAAVEVALAGLPLEKGEARLEHFRIDETHGNAFTAWKGMGSPQKPTAEQYAQLEKAGKLTAMGAPEAIRVEDAKATVRLKLPRQAVSLLVLTW
jgi:xylan 1,4-beta-xylosidase